MAAPIAMPSPPPISDRTRLSVSSWRMSAAVRRRARRAPRARASCALARAISRLATLAQQISSTNPTTPRNSIDVTLRSLPIIESCIGSSRTPRPPLVCGNSRARPSATADRSACAALDARRPASSGRPPAACIAPRARRHVDERPHRPHAGAAEDLEGLRHDADDRPQNPVHLDFAARRWRDRD